MKFMQRACGPLKTAQRFAQGIVDVANSVMEKAIRVISVERGYDPRDYTLVAFGGAGGLHACDLAAALNIPRVMIPRLPGGLSALGILRADVIHDLSQTVRFASSSASSASAANLRAKLAPEFARIEKQGRAALRGRRLPPNQIRVERLLDIRYSGQAYEITVSAAGNFLAAFHAAHERRYGYSDSRRALEIVNIRMRVNRQNSQAPSRSSQAREQKRHLPQSQRNGSIFRRQALRHKCLRPHKTRSKKRILRPRDHHRIQRNNNRPSQLARPRRRMGQPNPGAAPMKPR